MSDLLPPHDDIDLALEDMGAALGASAVHGLLAGMACGGLALPAAQLRTLLAGELDVEDLDDGTFRELQAMDRTLRAQLADDELGFEILLPDDDIELQHRVQAMADWCDGFLGGFGSATGGRKDNDFSADVRSLLATISDFAHAEVGDDAATEEAERDFMELVEYLRMSALTLFLEVGCPPPGERPPAGPLH